MIGVDKPVYLEYDLPDADFVKNKQKQKDTNPSDDEFSVCSIPSEELTPGLKVDLYNEVTNILIRLFLFSGTFWAHQEKKRHKKYLNDNLTLQANCFILNNYSLLCANIFLYERLYACVS